MEQYIKKSEIVAEIEKRRKDWWYGSSTEAKYKKEECDDILTLIDTLEVKEIHEDIDLDLNPIFEEFGIDPDSRFASMFKEGFYKGVDSYLNKKEGKV